MKETLARLNTILESKAGRLLALSDAASALRPAPGKWSRKEILGHLVDSASNNHQRFVRAALAPDLVFPPYEQEGWVAVQRYGEESWLNLIELWLAYNRHLLHVMSSVPESALEHRCVVGGGEPVSLRDLMAGYVDHLQHHLSQILGGG